MSTPINGGGYYWQPRIDFNWISESWTQFKRNSGTWMVTTLLAGILIATVYAILFFATGFWGQMMALAQTQQNNTSTNPFTNMYNTGPMTVEQLVIGFAGATVIHFFDGCMLRMAIRQVNGEIVEVGDLFKVGDVALPLLAFSSLMSVVNMLGGYMCYIPTFIMDGLFMFAPCLIVDRRMPVGEAMSTSLNMLKSTWLMAALFAFVLSLLSGLGVIACCVGELVTVPMTYLSIAIGYASYMYGQQTPGYAMGYTPDYGQQSAGTWPPPPGQQPPYTGPPPGPTGQ